MRSVVRDRVAWLREVLIFVMLCRQLVGSLTSGMFISGSGEDAQMELEDQPDPKQDDEIDFNATGIGEFLGSKCKKECNTRLLNVHCDPATKRCLCDRKFTVRLGATKGCAKPVKLGEQCFYAQTCVDLHAVCIQDGHNAVCQCKPGFHPVTLHKPAEKYFCSEDLVVVSTDMTSLLGVASGVAIFSALICFVLKLFVGARPRHYATTHLSQPIIYAKDKGIVLGLTGVGVHGRPSYRSSRSSSQRSVNMNAGSFSRHGSRGVLVPSSRAGAARVAAIRLLISCHFNAHKNHSHGSRRPSLTSVQSNASSLRSMSYSMMRFEKEREQKTEREVRRKEAAGSGGGGPITPTPSPNRSTEKLLVESTTQPQVSAEMIWSNNTRLQPSGPDICEIRNEVQAPKNQLLMEPHLPPSVIPEET